ncbi:Isocitrate lyase [Verticillium dahliae VDG1]|nr:Isocitrate lyase [Verticillium dahliae VDG1]
MSSTTNVLITGAGRGLGRGFLTTFLARPNHIVIGSIRDLDSTTAQDLRAITPASGSRLILVKIEATSTTDPADAIRQIEAEGVSKLDVVIANSGITGTQGGLETPLFDKAENPKWVSISTLMATINGLEKTAAWPSVPYSASKAALNFITKSIHIWRSNITAISVHPGFVATDMGKSGIKFYNLPEEAAISVEDSVSGVTKLVDNATRAEHSGKFISYDGSFLEW